MDSSQEWYGYTDDLSEVTSTVTMYLPDRDPEDFGRKKGKIFKFCLVFSCLVLFCFVCFVLFCFVVFCWFGLFWFVCFFLCLLPKCHPLNLVSDIFVLFFNLSIFRSDLQIRGLMHLPNFPPKKTPPTGVLLWTVHLNQIHKAIF